MEQPIHVRVLFKDKMAQKFKAIKDKLGVNNNTEVVRILLNKEYSRIKEPNPVE